jgi:hypothetical protein
MGLHGLEQGYLYFTLRQETPYSSCNQPRHGEHEVAYTLKYFWHQRYKEVSDQVEAPVSLHLEERPPVPTG